MKAIVVTWDDSKCACSGASSCAASASLPHCSQNTCCPHPVQHCCRRAAPWPLTVGGAAAMHDASNR